MSAGNVAFINSKFTANTAMEFSKPMGQGVALINCVMPALPARVAWVRGDAPPRPNQLYLTYHLQDTIGTPSTSPTARPARRRTTIPGS